LKTDSFPKTTPLQNRIRLGQLRVLVDLAESGSLLATAKRLHISQPAATKTLKQLEEALADTLVRRTPGGSVLTPSGELVCRRARVILAELQHMEEEIGSFHAGSSGQVVVGTLAVAASQLVPRTLAALARDFPRITVRVVESTSATLYPELKLGRLDLLVGRSWPGEDAALLTETLFLQARLKLPEHCVETSSYVVIRSLLLATDMVCLQPVEAVAEDFRNRTLARLPVDVDLPLPAISIVRSAERELAPAAKTVLNYFRASARTMPQAP
jgi:molybdate transport repressor ModE-like protein